MFVNANHYNLQLLSVTLDIGTGITLLYFKKREEELLFRFLWIFHILQTFDILTYCYSVSHKHDVLSLISSDNDTDSFIVSFAGPLARNITVLICS